jgi:hypothetical protein
MSEILMTARAVHDGAPGVAEQPSIVIRDVIRVDREESGVDQARLGDMFDWGLVATILHVSLVGKPFKQRAFSTCKHVPFFGGLCDVHGQRRGGASESAFDLA